MDANSNTKWSDAHMAYYLDPIASTNGDKREFSPTTNWGKGAVNHGVTLSVQIDNFGHIHWSLDGQTGTIAREDAWGKRAPGEAYPSKLWPMPAAAWQLLPACPLVAT